MWLLRRDQWLLAESGSAINDSVITGHERNYQKTVTTKADSVRLWLTGVVSGLGGFTMPRSSTGKRIEGFP